MLSPVHAALIGQLLGRGQPAPIGYGGAGVPRNFSPEPGLAAMLAGPRPLTAQPAPVPPTLDGMPQQLPAAPARGLPTPRFQPPGQPVGSQLPLQLPRRTFLPAAHRTQF